MVEIDPPPHAARRATRRRLTGCRSRQRATATDLAGAPRPPFSPASPDSSAALPHNEFLTNKKGAKMFIKLRIIPAHLTTTLTGFLTFLQSCLAAATQKAAVLAAAILASALRPPFSPVHHGCRSCQHRRPLLLLPHNEFLTNKKGEKMFKKITNHPCLPDNNTHRFSDNPASPPPHKRLLFSPARQKSAMCRSPPPPPLLNVLLWPMRNATPMPISPRPLKF